MTGMKIAATGIFWFRDDAQYRAFKKVFTDSHLLPDTFAEWRSKAEQVVLSIERSGSVAVKVEATPEEFVAWAKAGGHNVDASGRMRFAADKAADSLKISG